MPSVGPNNNNNASNTSGRGRGNQNGRFHRRIVNGRLQLSRRQPQLNSDLNAARVNQGQYGLSNPNPSGIRRTVFNSPGGIQQFPASLTGLPRPRQFNPNRGGFFQHRQYGQPNNRAFRNPRNSSGVLGRMEPDGTFVPINPQDLFGFPPRNDPFAAQPPRPLFPGVGPPGLSPNAKKKVLCKHYVNARGCLNRPRCNYMHEDFPCKLYHILGECTQGSECKFSHERMSNQTKHILAMHVEKGAESFPRMSRAQVLAAVGEQELRRDSTPEHDNTDFVIDTSSPQLQELELVTSADVSQTSIQKRTETETGEETKTTIVQSSVAEVVKPVEPPGPTIHQIIQIMRKKIQQTCLSKENENTEIAGSLTTVPASVCRAMENQSPTPAFGNIQISLNIQNPGSSADPPTFRSVSNVSPSVLTQSRLPS